MYILSGWRHSSVRRRRSWWHPLIRAPLHSRRIKHGIVLLVVTCTQSHLRKREPLRSHYICWPKECSTCRIPNSKGRPSTPWLTSTRLQVCMSHLFLNAAKNMNTFFDMYSSVRAHLLTALTCCCLTVEEIPIDPYCWLRPIDFGLESSGANRCGR